MIIRGTVSFIKNLGTTLNIGCTVLWTLLGILACVHYSVLGWFHIALCFLMAFCCFMDIFKRNPIKVEIVPDTEKEKKELLLD